MSNRTDHPADISNTSNPQQHDQYQSPNQSTTITSGPSHTQVTSSDPSTQSFQQSQQYFNPWPVVSYSFSHGTHQVAVDTGVGNEPSRVHLSISMCGSSYQIQHAIYTRSTDTIVHPVQSIPSQLSSSQTQHSVGPTYARQANVEYGHQLQHPSQGRRTGDQQPDTFSVSRGTHPAVANLGQPRHSHLFSQHAGNHQVSSYHGYDYTAHPPYFHSHIPMGIGTTTYSVQSLPDQGTSSQTHPTIVPVLASQTLESARQSMIIPHQLTNYRYSESSPSSTAQTEAFLPRLAQGYSMGQRNQSELERFVGSRSPQTERPPLTKRPRVYHFPEQASLYNHSLVEPSSSQQLSNEPSPLTLEDFRLAYEAVYSAHPKWYNIGLALGIPAYTLDSIYVKCLADSSKCLRETILTRLRKKRLTWSDITTALMKHTVGEAELARRLERKYCKHGLSADTRGIILGEPSLNIEELCALPVEDVWYPLGLWLGVEEETLRMMKGQSRDKSVEAVFKEFLDICTSSQEFPVGSQDYWKFIGCLPYEKRKEAQELLHKNDTKNFKEFIQNLQEEQEVLAKKLIQTKFYKLTMLVRALMKVGKRDVAERICLMKDESLTDYLDATDSAITPECVLRYASYLKDRYRQMSALPDPDWPPAIASKDHYTNLALIQQERSQHPRISDMHKMAKDYAHGQIDRICAMKQYIQLEEALYPIINPDTSDSRLTILMDGAPGVGKTTITRKLCIDWAKGTILQEYQLVILVPLRELKFAQSQLKSITDLIPADDLLLKDQVSKYLNETSGAYTLIIFDGYDELGSKERSQLQSSLISDIINGSKLHQCSVLVTSRPYASGPLRGLKRVNRHIEVLGFSEDQIADCVTTNLPDKEGKQLLEELEQRLDIGSLCYIPLNCRIVLYVYTQEDFNLPATLTELYKIFILHTIKHYAPKITSDSLVLQKINEARKLDALPDSILMQLNDLCLLAFSGMKKDNLVFDSLELRASHDQLSLGLMTSLHCFSTTGVLEHFQFLHLTIQEFLAARHVASDAMSSEEKRQFLKTNIVNERFRMTLLFLAGLTHFNFLQPNEPLLEDQTSYLSGDDRKERLLFLAQLIYESKSSSFRILTILKSRLDMSGYRLTKFDCLVLAYFLSATPKNHIWEVINFADCRLTSFSILFARKHLANFHIPAIAMTKRLTLSCCWIDDNDSISIPAVTSILSASSALPSKKLQLEGIANCKHVVEFSRVLANHHNLLAIDCGVIAISKRVLFSDGSDLQPIKICSKIFQELLKFMTADEVKEICLISCPEFFEDCSKCGSSGRDAVQSLCEVLRRSKCIQTVNLEQCKLSDEATVSVIASLSDKKSQVDVIMDQSEMSIRGLVNILNSLSNTINFYCTIFPIKVHIDEDMLLHLRHLGSNVCIDLTSLIENIPSQFRGFGVELHYLSEEVVASLIQASKSIQYLKLNRLELTAIPKLQRLLSHVSPKELHFLNCGVFQRRWIGNEISPLTQAIQTLQVLTLSGCGDIVISHLAAGLTHNTTLLELNVSKNQSITSHGWVQLFNALKLGPTPLQKLDIGENNLDPESISALNEIMLCLHQTLTTLRLSSCSIDDHSLEALVGGLKTLREVIIRNNKRITSKGWVLLFQALQSTSINTIDISDNKLGDEGLSALREFLHHNETITVFKAHDCGLTDDVVEEIVDSLSHKSSLSKLGIKENYFITSECWIQLLQALHQNTLLRKLNIHRLYEMTSTVGGDDRGRLVRALSEMITCNKGITELTISGDFIEGEYILLARALLQNTTLQILKTWSGKVVQTLELEIDILREEMTHASDSEVSPDWNLRIMNLD